MMQNSDLIEAYAAKLPRLATLMWIIKAHQSPGLIANITGTAEYF